MSRPSYAVILIQDEVIADVIAVRQDREIEELVLEYIDWNPINMEHHYVSPGMIDFNIRRNRDWESVESLTKTAVSGGVTLCVEERTLEESDLQEQGHLYCDLAYTVVIEPSVVLSLRPEDFSDALALKGYLCPPNDRIGAVHDLKQWFAIASRGNLPLLLDPSVLDRKVLCIASPCRLLAVDQRGTAEDFAEVFGGAFGDDDNCVGSDDEEEKIRVLAPVREQRRREEDEEVGRKFSLAATPITKSRKEDTRVLTVGHIPDLKVHNKTIHSALEDKIYESAEKRETLVSAEILSYRGVGCTRPPLFARSMSDVHLSRLPEPESPLPKKRRPAPIAITPTKHLASDAAYLQQLAYYPDDMENKGVKRIVKALKSVPCKVHVTNLSSASAIASIRKARAEKVEITCETCPHFLYFTDQMVTDGDTRLKNFPPIRNKSNCNFLWELVTMNSVDAICSQHIPVPEVYKFHPNFRKALSGISGLGFTLQVMWTLLKRPFADLQSFEHYLVRLARWTSNNPAKILQLHNRGAIEKGYIADLVIWSPLEKVIVQDTFCQQRDQCPYLGTELYGRVEKVLVRGKLAFADGVLYPVGKPVRRPEA